MQYNRLGNSGLIISRLAFGAMTFGSARESPMAHVFNTRMLTSFPSTGRVFGT